MSPDGQSLVFAARAGEHEQLWLRSLDSPDLRPIDGTDGRSSESQPQSPFWSPDGRTLGFFVQTGFGNAGHSRLKTVSRDGGAALTLAEVPSNNAGATWSEDDVILLASSGTNGVQRMTARGGTPTQVTTLDSSRGEVAHLRPQFLPDWRHFIFQSQTSDGRERSIWVGSIESSDRKLLVGSEYAQFIPPDVLLYTRGNAVLSQRPDLAALELVGKPTQVVRYPSVPTTVARPFRRRQPACSCIRPQTWCGDS